MNRIFGKMLGFINAEMFIITNIYQAVISFPAIGMNNTFRGNFTPDNALKCFGRTVCDQLGVNCAVSFINAKYRLFECSASTLPGARPSPDSGWAEKALVNFNHTNNFFPLKGLVCIN